METEENLCYAGRTQPNNYSKAQFRLIVVLHVTSLLYDFLLRYVYKNGAQGERLLFIGRGGKQLGLDFALMDNDS